MRMSKRQFMKTSLGGTIAVLIGPSLKTGSVLASPVVLPAGYLESGVHAHWMNLSYNRSLESRKTRRTLGVALRNIGAVKGKGRGWEFARVFDQAVHAAYERFAVSGRRPATMFGLVQSLYDEFIHPQTGADGGMVLFGTLLSVLRGRDGTAQGTSAHESYLAYRAASLRHKDIYQWTQDSKAIDEARRQRAAARTIWQDQLTGLIEAYADRKLALQADFPIQAEWLAGFDIHTPLSVGASRMAITRVGRHVTVTWKGQGRLQQAPDVSGPWSDVNLPSPATFDPRAGKMFYRTVQSDDRSSVGRRPGG